MKCRLNSGDFRKASVDGLERLAKFLGLQIAKKANESEGAYRRRLVLAISRWEKEYQYGQR